MRNILVVLSCLLVFTAGCKTKSSCNTAAGDKAGKTCGVISHQYTKSGCGTVIVINKPESDAPQQILIPKDKLEPSFDKDGLRVYFNFRLLKMPNPAGCTIGNMAEITELSK